MPHYNKVLQGVLGTQYLYIMDIEYNVEKKATENQKVVAWGCFAKCYYNFGTISKGSAAA